MKATGPGWELRLGEQGVALASVRADVMMVDGPYSERTHTGHYSAETHDSADQAERRSITYAPWTPADVDAFVAEWEDRIGGWWVSLTDDELAPAWKAAYRNAGLYVFPALPCIVRGARCRMQGDGPSSVTTFCVVGRPRTRPFATWGTLPGYYEGPRVRMDVVGGKPLWLMQALVRDYSQPGDVIADPCAGGGTTLLAAVTERRSGIGAELDQDTYSKAVDRMRRGYTPALDFGAA